MHPVYAWEDKDYAAQGTRMYEEKGQPEDNPTYFRVPEYGSSVEKVGGLSTMAMLQAGVLRQLPTPMYHPPGYSGVPPLAAQPFPWGDVVDRIVAIEMSMHAGDVERTVTLVNDFRPWFLALRKRCAIDDLSRLTELDTRLMAIEEWLGKYTNPGAFGYMSPNYADMTLTTQGSAPWKK